MLCTYSSIAGPQESGEQPLHIFLLTQRRSVLVGDAAEIDQLDVTFENNNENGDGDTPADPVPSPSLLRRMLFGFRSL